MTLDRFRAHPAYCPPAPRRKDARPAFQESDIALAGAAMLPVDGRPLLLDAIRRLARGARTWLEQRTRRRRLLRLNDHMLSDVGLSRRDLERDLPVRWIDR